MPLWAASPMACCRNGPSRTWPTSLTLVPRSAAPRSARELWPNTKRLKHSWQNPKHMFEPTSTLALIMTMTSAVCWGSWANTGKMTRNYRFELFYWDYAIGIVVISLVWAFTLGSTGGDNSFLSNLGVADTQNMGSAMIGGVIFNISNFLLGAGVKTARPGLEFPLVHRAAV